MRAIDPITITTTDGQERKLLLTMGGLRRLKAKFGVKDIKSLLDHDAEEAGVPLLYEALIDKSGLTEEQFADLLPAHLSDMVVTMSRLLGASFPESKADPMTPTPTVQ